ncbi:MAG: ATPase domain-containing protein [Nanoarchaeota archaeon]
MIKVNEFMIKDVITEKSSSNVFDAAELMIKSGVSCLVILQNKKPIGLLTERSIIRNILLKGKNPKKIKTNQAMHQIDTVNSDTGFFSLVNFMRKKNLRRVVVVDKNNLVGIVTETDVVNTSRKLQKSLETDKKKRSKEILERLADASHGVRKTDSGYEGFDRVFGKGIPYGKNILLEGPPGCGKSIICFTYLKTGLEQNNKVLYICMNDIDKDIKEIFQSMGINVDKYQKRGDFDIINLYDEVIGVPERIYNEEEKLLVKDFSLIRKRILEITKNSKVPVRCVVNVISQSLVMHSARTVYKFALMLNELLKQNESTTFYLIHKGDENNEQIIPLEEIMDGVLEFSIKEGKAGVQRTIKVKKMQPEFMSLPQWFSYEFDKKRELHTKRLQL